MTDTTITSVVDEYIGDIEKLERLEIRLFLPGNAAIPQWAQKAVEGVCTPDNPRGDVLRKIEAYQDLTPKTGSQSFEICRHMVLSVDRLIDAVLARQLVLRNFKIGNKNGVRSLQWIWGRKDTFYPHPQIEANMETILQGLRDEVKGGLYSVDGWNNPHWIDQVDYGFRSITLNLLDYQLDTKALYPRRAKKQQKTEAPTATETLGEETPASEVAFVNGNEVVVSAEEVIQSESDKEIAGVAEPQEEIQLEAQYLEEETQGDDEYGDDEPEELNLNVRLVPMVRGGRLPSYASRAPKKRRPMDDDDGFHVSPHSGCKNSRDRQRQRWTKGAY